MSKVLSTSLIAALSLGLAACGSDSKSSDTTPTTQPSGGNKDQGGNTATATLVTVDASAGGFSAKPGDAKNKHTYFSFATGAVVELTDQEAEASSAWDIAFKRTRIKLNSANSTPAASGSLASTPDGLYAADGAPITAALLKAKAASEQDHFAAVTATSVADLTFAKDGPKPHLAKQWYNYNSTSHQVTAAADKSWIIRSAEQDKTAIFSVTKVVPNRQKKADSYTARFYLNTADKDQDYVFSAQPVDFKAEFTADKTQICYDLNTTAEVDCASTADSWDVRFDNDFNIWLNGGVHGSGQGGAFGPSTHDALKAFKSVPKFFTDSVSGTFTDSGSKWYAYSLNKQHKIWPNYRVYAIKKSDGSQYKVRILGFYAPKDSKVAAPGTSGVITFEYEKL